jgi:PAS domain-containing protein
VKGRENSVAQLVDELRGLQQEIDELRMARRKESWALRLMAEIDKRLAQGELISEFGFLALESDTRRILLKPYSDEDGTWDSPCNQFCSGTIVSDYLDESRSFHWIRDAGGSGVIRTQAQRLLVVSVFDVKQSIENSQIGYGCYGDITPLAVLFEESRKLATSHSEDGLGRAFHYKVWLMARNALDELYKRIHRETEKSLAQCQHQTEELDREIEDLKCGSTAQVGMCRLKFRIFANTLLMVLLSSNLPCFRTDSDLKFTSVSPSMPKMLGLSATELCGKTQHELFPESTEVLRDIGEDRGDNREKGMVRISEVTRTIGAQAEEQHFFLFSFSAPDEGLSTIGVLIPARSLPSDDLQDAASHEQFRAMEEVKEKVQKVAKTHATLLITGESGVGKDHLARQIHDLSDRSKGPFYSINCAAVPIDLAESELFGHEKGAFTGSASLKRGLLELADGGTLVLNEIGDASLAIQAKLLQFIPEFSTRVRFSGVRC